MKYRVIAVWYEDDRKKLGYGGTGLIIELENGVFLQHQSTDPIMPFEAVKTDLLADKI